MNTDVSGNETNADGVGGFLSEKSYQSVLGELKEYRVVTRVGQPSILLDGIADTASNLLSQVAIGIAANKALSLNPIFLSNVENKMVRQLSSALGFSYISLQSPVIAGRFDQMRRLVTRITLQCQTKLTEVEDAAIGKVRIGDLIYDSIVRNNVGIYTAKHFTKSILRKEINRAVYLYFFIKALITQHNIDYVVLSHKYYTLFGVLGRVATSVGAKVISCDRSHLKLLTSLSQHYESDYCVDEAIRKCISRLDTQRSQEFVRSRFSGELDHIDVRAASQGRQHYDEIELAKLLRIDRRLPICMIAAHGFSDAPHRDSWSLYDDYYAWLVATLDITTTVNNVHWIVKPHPEARFYRESGAVEEMLLQYPNVTLVPDSVRISDALNLVDTVVTVRGTVVLEAVQYDIKSILAGAAFFMDLGFTITCRTVEQYRNALTSITKKTAIDDEYKELAAKTLYWFRGSSEVRSYLFGPERAAGLPRHEAIAHDLELFQNLSDYLEHGDYESDVYFQALLRFFQNGDERLSLLDLVGGRASSYKENSNHL